MLMTIFTLPQAVDAVSIAIIGIFAIVGAARGALRGVLRIVAGLASIVVGRFASPWIAPPFGRLLALDPAAADALSIALVAALVLVALSLSIAHFDEKIQKARLPVVDPILGLALGIAFGAGLVTTLLLFITATSPRTALAQAIETSHAGHAAREIYNFAEPAARRFGMREPVFAAEEKR